MENAIGGKTEAKIKAVWSGAYVNDLPDSAFLHILPGGEKDTENKTTPRSLRMFPYKSAEGAVDLPHLRNALARIPQSNRISQDVKTRLISKARAILAEQNKESVIRRIVKALTRPDPQQLFVVKDLDGNARWFGVPSNNYRDDDGVPEILSAQAHRDFVKAVDDGDWPMPELWLWHIPYRLGVTDFMAFDESSGMLIASGPVDVGKEVIVKACADAGDKMSHGMPVEQIERSKDDGTVLVRYRSKEFSALPGDNAANKITKFLAV